ncbi:MAG: radical SAM protein [Candidatus Omnitrophica bacterium]|nr:radical SAM protein [Candidatus Omnitrophota bacterium]
MKKCLGLPFNIFIEPTELCDYRCIKCQRFYDVYTDDGLIFGSKNMSFFYYRKVIDDIGDTLLTLRLWYSGEPLLNKDIFRMIEYAKKKDIVVVVSTVLSSLNASEAERLVKSGLDYLLISFDGASERTYNLYHGKKHFNKVVDNIRNIVVAKKKFHFSTPLVELQFIVMKENESQMNKIKNLSQELGVNKLTYQKLEKSKINFNKFKDFDSERDILPKNKDYCLNQKEIDCIRSCRVPWEETLIRYSGLVLPCCIDLAQKYKMGRLFQRGEYIGFRNIWNSNNYQDFRNQIVNRIDKIDICSNCSKKDNSCEDHIQFK